MPDCLWGASKKENSEFWTSHHDHKLVAGLRGWCLRHEGRRIHQYKLGFGKKKGRWS